MNPNVNYLITILNENELLKCALSINRGSLPGEFLMDDENKSYLHNILPLHVRSCGPIVDIEEIYEVTIIK